MSTSRLPISATWTLALSTVLLAGASGNGTALAGQAFVKEAEPNGTAATATPLGGASAVILGNVFPTNDVDTYSFPAAANDRVYAAVQTLFDASASGDSVLDVLDTDGATVLENDDNDGTFHGFSSSIAGTTIPANGTYYLRVRHRLATGTIRPYHLHYRLQSGAPTAETEPNNAPGTANPLVASGWVSGTITDVSPTEADYFSLTLAAGDSVFVSLDMNPERDMYTWEGRLGFGLLGNPPADQLVFANDPSGGGLISNPNSEAFFLTVKHAGTYYLVVDSVSPDFTDATYHLSVAVRPHVAATASCTTYTSTDVPVAIPSGPGMVSSTLTVPGNPRIADLDVSINLNHTFMQDLDVHLVSPAGNDNGLFTDIGAAAVGGAQTLMDLRFDDEAALPSAFALSASMVLQPELAYRLSWFDGEDAGGTWMLVMRDDATGDAGTLNSWSITVCEPDPPPSCAPGFVRTTVLSTDFEAGDAGFSHSGTLDEWERGLPTFAPLTSCNSGSNCWATDLDSSYDASSSQDLLSPGIDLSGLSAPVVVSWAQRYQLESASFDHALVEARQVGSPGNAVRLFDWLDATMNSTVGNPAVTIAESAGWGLFSRRADAMAGLNTELRFHLDSDTTVQLAGFAIDDVTVTACRPITADLSITKTDGVATALAGGPVSYTIVASNAGPDAVTGATVTDTFPAELTCSWTCTGSGGACTAEGTGNISDAVDLSAGGNVTYAVSCALATTAGVSLSNTASVTAPTGVGDPATPGLNEATDTDAVAFPAAVSAAKTVAGSSTVGGTLVYTVTLGNAGPGGQGDNPGDELTDVLPAGLALVSASASSGTAVADIGANTVHWNGPVPAGGSVTVTITASILPAAAGTTVANQGALAYDADGDGLNETGGLTDDPGAAGAADPTEIAILVTLVPVASSLGLAALALLLAAFALAALKR